MRISDWSSDVCSSDLLSAASVPGAAKRRGQERRGQEGRGRKERQGLGRLRDGAAAVYTATGRAASFKHLICLGFPQPVWRRDRFSVCPWLGRLVRSEEHTSELQSLMRISYAVFCLKKKKQMTVMIYSRVIEKHS